MFSPSSKAGSPVAVRGCFASGRVKKPVLLFYPPSPAAEMEIAATGLTGVSVSKVGGIFVHKRRDGPSGQKSTPRIREDAMQEKLTPEQEAQAQELAALVSEAIAADVLQVARLLVSKKTKDTFGQTEFQQRDPLHKIGPRALEVSLAQKKTATSALA